MSYAATGSAIPAETFVDFEGALRVLHEMGIKSATLRKVRRWADMGVLPFFDELGPRHIAVSVLQARIGKMQSDAVRGGRTL